MEVKVYFFRCQLDEQKKAAGQAALIISKNQNSGIYTLTNINPKTLL